jgi:UDP:flavonoid glycosyltransferase YjiC (YdhE family)
MLTVPVDGHFNPLVPIMSKLVLKGHNVVCITGRNYKNRVENTELKKKKGLSQIKYYIKHILYDPVPDI